MLLHFDLTKQEDFWSAGYNAEHTYSIYDFCVCVFFVLSSLFSLVYELLLLNLKSSMWPHSWLSNFSSEPGSCICGVLSIPPLEHRVQTPHKTEGIEERYITLACSQVSCKVIRPYQILLCDICDPAHLEGLRGLVYHHRKVWELAVREIKIHLYTLIHPYGKIPIYQNYSVCLILSNGSHKGSYISSNHTLPVVFGHFKNLKWNLNYLTLCSYLTSSSATLYLRNLGTLFQT